MHPTTSARALAGLLGIAGVMHFLQPKFFDAIVPPSLPGSARAWTLGSGVAELAVGAAIANPSTRRAGALAAAVLFIGVFPGNIQAAVVARTTLEKALTWGRLPLQIPLVMWALRVRKG